MLTMTNGLDPSPLLRPFGVTTERRRPLSGSVAGKYSGRARRIGAAK